jgi:hypothetical protein
LLDGTLARLAVALEMDVADHDTSPGAGAAGGPDSADEQRGERPVTEFR